MNDCLANTYKGLRARWLSAVVPELNHHTETISRSFSAVLTLSLGLSGLLLFTHRYRGVCHDAILYALQALKHTNPDLFSEDLFFRYGSQDSFTGFPPLYAALVRLVGLEMAAHIVARGSILCLCGSVWLLARRLLSRELCWLALALFIVVPGRYGASYLFSYGEDFATPRCISEALVLTSLAFWIVEKHRLALLAIAASFILHPLVALPGLLVAALAFCPLRWRIGLIASLLLASFAALAVALFAPFRSLSMLDAEWRRVLMSMTPYVFVDTWSLSEWQPTIVTLATLICVSLVFPLDLSRRLAFAALCVSGMGLVIAVVASRLSPIVLAIQIQPWRWVWLGKALTVVLLAPLSITLWRRGIAGRGVLALLAVAWIGPDNPVALVAAMCAVIAAFFEARGGLNFLHGRILGWVSFFAAAALALALWRNEGTLPLAGYAAAIGTAWILTFGRTPAVFRLIPTMAAAALFAVQSVHAVFGIDSGLVAPRYDEHAYDSFATWRSRIRPDQTVLNLTNPELVWLLLHRKNYAGFTDVLFSRAAASVAFQRKKFIDVIFPQQELTTTANKSSSLASNRISAQLSQFRELCQDRELDYFMTKMSLPLPHLTSDGAGEFAGYSLYACTSVRNINTI